MMIASPARAQRSARPLPAGPVPPSMAMGCGSGKLRLQIFFGRELLRRQLELDAGICCVAFGGNASSFENQRLKILGAGVLARGGAGLAGNVFFHQSAAVIVGAGMQARSEEHTS